MSPSSTIRPGVQTGVQNGVQTGVDPVVDPSLRPGAPPGAEEERFEESGSGGGFGSPRADEYRYMGPVAAVSFTLDPANLVRLLGAVVIPVVSAGFLVVLVAAFAGLDLFSGGGDILAIFTLGRSPNLASWFACLCFFVSATALALLGAIASASGDTLARDWRRLGWVFLLVSVDQVCAVHETALSAIHRMVSFPRTFDFAWLILATAALFFYFRPLMACLPPRTRNRFALSAIIYFFGALGMEFAGRATPSANGIHGLWEFSALFDRILQMTGLLLFMRSLVDHLTDYAPRFGVRLDRRKRAPAR